MLDLVSSKRDSYLRDARVRSRWLGLVLLAYDTRCCARRRSNDRACRMARRSLRVARVVRSALREENVQDS